MTMELKGRRRTLTSGLWLALTLMAVTAGCGMEEFLPDPDPYYYYCIYTPDITLLPGEVADLTITDGTCTAPKKAEILSINEAKPFLISFCCGATEGVTVTPTGTTSSNQIRVSADVSLAEKPWLLKTNWGHTSYIRVTLTQPRRFSDGTTVLVRVRVLCPDDVFPVNQKDVRLSAVPDRLHFGTVKVSSEAAQTLAVHNNGKEDAALSAVLIANCTAPCRYQVSGLSAGSTIPAGGFRTVTVVCRPTARVIDGPSLLIHPTKGNMVEVPLFGSAD